MITIFSRRILLLLIFLFILLSASAQKDTVRSGMRIDLGFTRDRNVNMWPFLKVFKSKEEKDVQVLFPFFRSKNEYTIKRRHSHLVPLWWNTKSPGMRDLRLLTVLYPSVIRVQKDTIDTTRSIRILELAPEINLIEFTRSKNGMIVNNNILFLLWYKNNKKTQRSSLIGFPLWWSFANKNGSSNTLFPLFSYGKQKFRDYHYFGITPLYWHSKDDLAHHNTLFPIWWESKRNIGGKIWKKNLILPFYWSQNDPNGKRRFILPFLWSSKQKKYSSFTFAPFFSYGKNSDNSRNHRLITPLFWHAKTNTAVSNVVFPLWWSRIEEKKSSRILFPVFWNFRNPSYNSLTVLPFFSVGQAHDSSSYHRIITPFLWSVRSKGQTSNVLFPLLWYTRMGKKEMSLTFFPLWWSYKYEDSGYQIFFPLLWKRWNSHESKITFFPLYSASHSTDKTKKFVMISPLFWKHVSPRETTYSLFPLWTYRKKGDDTYFEITNRIFPLFWSKKTEESSFSTLFPILWASKNKVYRSFTLMPFFSYGKSNDSLRAHVAVTPLFWHIKSRYGITNFFFPVWWRSKTEKFENKKIFTSVFPFYWRFKDKDRSNAILFPLVWKTKNKHYESFSFMPFYSKGHSLRDSNSHFAITPFFWHYKRNDGHINMLLPVWFNKNRGTGDFNEHSNVLFPLYWAYHNRKRDDHILFPFYYSIKNNHYNSFTLFPVFSSGKNISGTKHHTVIAPLYWHFASYHKSSQLLLPFMWSKTRIDGEDTITSRFLLPLLYQEKSNEKKKAVLFPFLWSKEEFNYRKITLFPLFSLKRNHDRTFVSFHSPLFHYNRSNNQANTVFFPVWWSKRNGSGDDKSSLNVLFPLLWKYKSRDNDNLVFFPFWWQFKNKYNSSLTIFPLLSTGHSADGKRSHLVLTPLYWNIRNDSTRHVSFIPFFNMTHKPGGEKHFDLLYFLLRSDVTKSSSSMHLLWPLCQYSRDEDSKYFRFAPIVWYKKTAESSWFSVQPFYYHGKNAKVETWHFFWELFTYRNYFDKKTSRSILWKTLFWDRYKNGDHEFRFLYLLYANVKKEGNVERSFFPFYYYNKQSNGNKTTSLLFYFFTSIQRQIPNTSEYYKEIKLFWFVRLLSNYKALHEKGLMERRKNSEQRN
ncbi:MAG: hypothetical protein V2A54_07975 [Bacteroidota bacterium]